MPVYKVSDSSHERSGVQVSVDTHPGGFVVHRIEGVKLVVEQQELLAVAAGCAAHTLLLSVDPASKDKTLELQTIWRVDMRSQFYLESDGLVRYRPAQICLSVFAASQFSLQQAIPSRAYLGMTISSAACTLPGLEGFCCILD